MVQVCGVSRFLSVVGVRPVYGRQYRIGFLTLSVATSGRSSMVPRSKHLLTLGLFVSVTIAAVAQGPQSPPVANPALTGEAPLPRLGEKDADGRTVYRARLTGHLTNYYEEKIRPYTLPGPLTTDDGRRVVDAQMWLKERRPEILKMFQTEIYGRVPDTAPRV